MTETIKLETKHVDGMCSIHDCERISGYLWRVVDIDVGDDSVEVHTSLAEYCSAHSQSHAEIRENLYYIGSFERLE